MLKTNHSIGSLKTNDTATDNTTEGFESGEEKVGVESQS